MRSYAPIKPTIWFVQGEVKTIMDRYSEREVMLYMYLLTSPHAHLSGIYQCPIIYIANETGLSATKVKRGLKNLSDVELVYVDTATDIVWLPKMINQTVGRLAEPDNKFKGIKSHLGTLPRCILVDYFCELNDIPLPELKPLVSPLQAPSKPTFLSIPCSSGVGVADAPTCDDEEMGVVQ